jgi:hypothetical protein
MNPFNRSELDAAETDLQLRHAELLAEYTAERQESYGHAHDCYFDARRDRLRHMSLVVSTLAIAVVLFSTFTMAALHLVMPAIAILWTVYGSVVIGTAAGAIYAHRLARATSRADAHYVDVMTDAEELHHNRRRNT